MSKILSIMDKMIDSVNADSNIYKFYLSQYSYKIICKKLGRNVKTYRGFKVFVDSTVGKQKIYLLQ